MAIKISKETMKRTRKLSLSSKSDLTQVSIANVEAIAPSSSRRLPISVWFFHQDTFYEFLTPEIYKQSPDTFNTMLRLAKKYPTFKLYVKNHDHLKFIRFVEECKYQAASKDKPPEEKLKNTIINLKEKTDSILSNISEMNITPDIATQSKKVVKEVVTSVFTQEKIVTLLSKMLETNEKFLDEVIATTMVATSIGKKMDLPAEHLSVLTLCGLFHNIGEGKLPSRLIGPDKELTGDEFEIYKSHTVLGQEMLEELCLGGLKLPAEVQVVALQHHEKFNGCGYPNKKYGRQEENGPVGIHLYARIMAVADRYVELIQKIKLNNLQLTQAEILGRMFKQDGSFDPKILEHFKDLIKKEI